MSAKTNPLHSLKRFDFEAASTNLWIAKRYLKGLQAHYSVRWVDTENKLKRKLAKLVENQINGANAVQEYDYLSEDQDDNVLRLDAAQTDFEQIYSGISEGTDAEKATNVEDVYGAWLYAIELRNGNSALIAFKKIKDSWTAKKASTLQNLLFRDQKFVDLDETAVFRVERSIDFVWHAGSLLILNKKNFESALNFRAGMEKSCQDLLVELDGMKLFDDLAPIKSRCTTHLRSLRRFCMIRNNGFFRDKKFWKRLKELNASEGWGLEFHNGRIKVDDDNVELILKLMNNDRLKSLLNETWYDTSVKSPVGSPTG